MMPQQQFSAAMTVTPEIPASAYRQAYDDLAGQLSRLGEEVDRLLTRIEPVLRPAEGPDTYPEDPRVTTSPVVYELGNLKELATQITYRVIGARERCEL